MNFKGNKSALPTKICEACGRPMSWRKSWAKNWAEVKYCSDACRRLKAARQPAEPADCPAGDPPNVAGPSA
ncbi:MAG: DUF2256 domain-containing protein [Polaromonas sp.]|nr:DUF2256 domain-containing protein [Polaromonas sp.]